MTSRSHDRETRLSEIRGAVKAVRTSSSADSHLLTVRDFDRHSVAYVEDLLHMLEEASTPEDPHKTDDLRPDAESVLDDLRRGLLDLAERALRRPIQTIKRRSIELAFAGLFLCLFGALSAILSTACGEATLLLPVERDGGSVIGACECGRCAATLHDAGSEEEIYVSCPSTCPADAIHACFTSMLIPIKKACEVCP